MSIQCNNNYIIILFKTHSTEVKTNNQNKKIQIQ